MANKLIIKNSIILIIRLVLTLFLSLLASKILLMALGVDVFGVFYVALGIVLLMGFLHGALTSAFQRYFSYYSINEQYEILILALKVIFKISLFLLIASLSVGLWFVDNQLNMSNNLRVDITTAYIYVVFGFMFLLAVIPFHALLVSQNNAVGYSVCTILDVLLKLLSAVVVLYVDSGVILYAQLYLLSSFLSFVVSFLVSYPAVKTICQNKEKNIEFNIAKELNGYILWSVWGNLASALSNHGGNILINVFFLPVHSASRVVSAQLSGVINSGIGSIQLSLTPLLVRLYASGELLEMLKVSYRASRIYFNLCLLVILPCFYFSEEIMNLWLSDNKPEYAGTFFRMTLMILLIDSLSLPLMVCAQATGNIKRYQVLIGGLLLFIVPITWFFYYLDFGVETIYVVALIFSIVCLMVRLHLLKGMIGLKISSFIEAMVKKLLQNVITLCGLFYVINSSVGDVTHWGVVIVIYMIFGSLAYINVEVSSKEKEILLKFISRNVNVGKDVQ